MRNSAGPRANQIAGEFYNKFIGEGVGGRGGGGTRGRGGDERDGPSRRPGDCGPRRIGRDTSRGDARDATGSAAAALASRGRAREARAIAVAIRGAARAMCRPVRDESGVARGVHVTAPRMSQWRTSLLKVQRGDCENPNSRPPAPKAGIIPLEPRRLRALRRTAGGDRSAEKRRKARAERGWRIGTPKCPASYFIFVRPTAQICDSSTPGRTAGKNFSRATVTFLPRRWFARLWSRPGGRVLSAHRAGPRSRAWTPVTISRPCVLWNRGDTGLDLWLARVEKSQHTRCRVSFRTFSV